MSGIIKISEATSLAIHTIYLLANNSDKLYSNKELAFLMSVSENHLAKVMQRLVKLDYVSSIRGAKGGFRLNKKPSDINILEIYEIFDGKIKTHSCLLDKPICNDNKCIFSNILTDINEQIVTFMKNKTFENYK